VTAESTRPCRRPSLNSLTFRQPRPADAIGIWRLVRESDSLELNSSYTYVLVCSHFAGTSSVAGKGSEIHAFVAAYRPPAEHNALFVWQVGVSSEQRRGGVALEMLLRLCGRAELRDVRFLLATVDPANEASARLFRAFARERQSAVRVESGFAASLFAEVGHPEEQLYRIGPFSSEERNL